MVHLNSNNNTDEHRKQKIARKRKHNLLHVLIYLIILLGDSTHTHIQWLLGWCTKMLFALKNSHMQQQFNLIRKHHTHTFHRVKFNRRFSTYSLLQYLRYTNSGDKNLLLFAVAANAGVAAFFPSCVLVCLFLILSTQNYFIYCKHIKVLPFIKITTRAFSMV